MSPFLGVGHSLNIIRQALISNDRLGVVGVHQSIRILFIDLGVDLDRDMYEGPVKINPNRLSPM